MPFFISNDSSPLKKINDFFGYKIKHNSFYFLQCIISYVNYDDSHISCWQSNTVYVHTH